MSGFKFDAANMLEGLAETHKRTQAALNLFGETGGKKLEAYAKRNYPWTDRSWTASKTLTGDYEWEGTTLRITLEHGVDYGVWLEYAHGGKYAILWPTIHANSNDIMKGLDNLLGRR